jgi:hypothetical protein
MPAKSRRRLAKLALFIGACLFSLALLEGLLTAYAWCRYRAIDVAELERIQTGNVEAAVDNSQGGDTVADNYYPHPYLAWVRNRKGEKGGADVPLRGRINNVGLYGRDFPLVKDPAKFTIFVSGGSVARMFCSAGQGDQNYLEQILNERYEFDRPVVVLNGANNAWHQPQQAIAYLLYGELADAIVTLDGFNEHFFLRGIDRRLEYPEKTFQNLNPIASQGFAPLAAAWQAQQLKRFAQEHRWRTVYFATRAMRSWLEQSAAEAPPGFSIETMFALPREWSRTQRAKFNLAQFRKYIRSVDRLAALYGARRAYFIQPCPAIDKPLTEEERVRVGDLSYRDMYREMTDSLLALGNEGLPVRDLLGIFANTPETIYSDRIHCAFAPASELPANADFRPSPGFKIMAEAMAKELAALWGLEEKSKVNSEK